MNILSKMFVFGLCFIATKFASAEPIRVMSFNIRYGSASDGDNHWNNRKSLVAKTVKNYNPDLLGTQECLKFQADFLTEQLGEYVYFGRSRMKTPNEHCGIFYRKDRFTWLAGGHFWLSETPSVPESKSWDSSLPRMVSWVLLSDKRDETAEPILFINTHFDHRGRTAREESAALIRKQIGRLQNLANNPNVIVCGDFNTDEGSPPYQAILKDNQQLQDTFRVKYPESQPDEGTFNGFRGRMNGPRIDWVLADTRFNVVEAAIDHMADGSRYPSDHFPVTAVLQSRLGEN